MTGSLKPSQGCNTVICASSFTKKQHSTPSSPPRSIPNAPSPPISSPGKRCRQFYHLTHCASQRGLPVSVWWVMKEGLLAFIPACRPGRICPCECPLQHLQHFGGGASCSDLLKRLFSSLSSEAHDSQIHGHCLETVGAAPSRRPRITPVVPRLTLSQQFPRSPTVDMIITVRVDQENTSTYWNKWGSHALATVPSVLCHDLHRQTCWLPSAKRRGSREHSVSCGSPPHVRFGGIADECACGLPS